MNKRNLLIALIFPIIVFIALTFYKQMKVMIGQEIILPIIGFDPRNILSGHYLIYRIDYGVAGYSNFCNEEDSDDSGAYVCLKRDKKNSNSYNSKIKIYYGQSDLEEESDCTAVIKGSCKNGRFTADIEKFYIPEEYAYSLDRAVRNSKGEIVLSVTKGGSAAIKDLLIDGKSWREYKEDKN